MIPLKAYYNPNAEGLALSVYSLHVEKYNLFFNSPHDDKLFSTSVSYFGNIISPQTNFYTPENLISLDSVRAILLQNVIQSFKEGLEIIASYQISPYQGWLLYIPQKYYFHLFLNHIKVYSYHSIQDSLKRFNSDRIKATTFDPHRLLTHSSYTFRQFGKFLREEFKIRSIT